MATRGKVNSSGVIAYHLGREPQWARDRRLAKVHTFEQASEGGPFGYTVGLIAVIFDKSGFSRAYSCDDDASAVAIVQNFVQDFDKTHKVGSAVPS